MYLNYIKKVFSIWFIFLPKYVKKEYIKNKIKAKKKTDRSF